MYFKLEAEVDDFACALSCFAALFGNDGRMQACIMEPGLVPAPSIEAACYRLFTELFDAVQPKP